MRLTRPNCVCSNIVLFSCLLFLVFLFFYLLLLLFFIGFISYCLHFLLLLLFFLAYISVTFIFCCISLNNFGSPDEAKLCLLKCLFLFLQLVHTLENEFLFILELNENFLSWLGIIWNSVWFWTVKD